MCENNQAAETKATLEIRVILHGLIFKVYLSVNQIYLAALLRRSFNQEQWRQA